jgi:hypothetical protein
MEEIEDDVELEVSARKEVTIGDLVNDTLRSIFDFIGEGGAFCFAITSKSFYFNLGFKFENQKSLNAAISS